MIKSFLCLKAKEISKAMVKFTISAAFISFLNVSAQASSHENNKTNILLLGDSLSASYGMKEKQGWVHLLNQQLMKEKRHYQIINASISGETTAGGLARLPKLFSDNKIDVLLIELGANDGLRGFPPQLIKKNILAMIELAEQHNIRVLLMQIMIPPNYGPRYNQLFENIFLNVISDKSKTTLLPFFMKPVAVKPELMLNDGIHPNQNAQPFIQEFMAKLLAENMLRS